MTGSRSTIVMSDGTPLLARRRPAQGEARADMVIVHGVSDHAGRWEHVADFFARCRYEVHSFDQRGHGASGGSRVDVSPFSLFVDDLAQVLAAVRSEAPSPRPLVVYGHSMGGLVATLHAISDHPHPDAYVLSAPSLSAATSPMLERAAAVLGRVAPGVRMDSGITGEQLSRDPTVGEDYFADPMVYRRLTARFGATFFAAMEEAQQGLAAIGTPALVVHGGDDRLVPPSASAPLAAVDGVERRVFPGLRHEIHNEPECDEVLGFIAGWLDDHLTG